MLKDLFGDTIQQLFEAEMDDHLGCNKHSSDGDHTGNRVEASKKWTLPVRSWKECISQLAIYFGD